MKKKVNVFKILSFIIGVLKLAIDVFRDNKEDDEVEVEELAKNTALFSDLSSEVVKCLFESTEEKEKFYDLVINNLKQQKNGTKSV